MMKTNLLIILSVLLVLNSYSQKTNLDVIKSSVYEKGNELYSSSIDEYKKNEFWGIWSVPFGESEVSSFLPNSNDITYSSENLHDYDLNTAWMVPNYGVGQFIEFKLEIVEDAYQFQGICNVFNGYCKSSALWKANARVKMLKVCFNNEPICYVELIDTWHFQSFDISSYIKLNNSPGFNGFLRFEIIEVYPGTKYKDVGFSEFLYEGSGN